MFFTHLKSFSPYSGHIYNELRAGIIRKNGKLIIKSDDRFDLMERTGYFPFREMRRNGCAYFVSDLELYDFFLATEETLKNYHVEYYRDWNFKAKEYLLEIFLSGYEIGITDFRKNIGISYNALTYGHKLEYLRNFCLYCLDFLYFDGELDKTLFYNLGYIQANLYLAFVEINNLEALAVSSSETAMPNEEAQIVEEPKRIEIYCNTNEIKKIWEVLTAPISTAKGTEQPVFSRNELEKYLGSMFCSGAFPDTFRSHGWPTPKSISRGDMRNVLIALMYSCYCLNRKFHRGSNQIMYVAMLKRYFSVFGTSKLESTKSVMATYTPKGIEVLKNSIKNNPYIEEMLSILKNHKLIH
ncbi:hypothetical protein HMPREF0765_4613 [Sphingobacterium spiritivorum ATCC 33300]|uniref:Uncharacterized protein n=1 Tax=Sphingobacterium spiritivorum ATCC 33300 TaxID=525372 RepID=C2G4V7_SPHSI|nr:hypothetical protein [Sphingobacterium spiritivorum]EEI89708.1 hypothetical protein HMPREF0765_4613 [Sphingobacterium spiritivorum ATCC 33300]QQS94760.1 hypothetical protein I6J03_15395 [Sphingobacterium spiritivorum]